MIDITEIRIGNTIMFNNKTYKIKSMYDFYNVHKKIQDYFPMKLSKDYFKSIGGVENELGDFEFDHFRVYFQENIYCQIYTGNSWRRASQGLTYVHEFENWHRWTQGTDEIQLLK